MKIDFVLTAGNINGHYTKLFPLIYKIWKFRFDLDCFLILVANEIPKYLLDFKNYIILWENKDMNDIYVAQVIRILYPALFPDKNILITDLDIFPVSKRYFLDSISEIEDNYFISYTDRALKQKMLTICYNVAKGDIWSQIFNIKTKKDINQRLKQWYNLEYTGKKNCPGWYTDQKKLFEYVYKWNKNIIILKDKNIGYKRLGNRQRDKEKILKNFDEICKNLDKYSDIHCIKPYSKTGWYLRTLTEKLINKN